MHAIWRFLADTSGATAIEYSIIGVLVSIALITGGSKIGTSMNDLFYTKALDGFK